MADIQRGSFRPVAAPRDTVAVQQRSLERGALPVQEVAPLAPNGIVMSAAPAAGPSGLEQLGAALSSFSPGVSALLGQRQIKKKKEDGVEAELLALRDNTMSWAEAVKADPSLAEKSPYFRKAYRARTARNRIQHQSGELLTEYYSSPLAASDDPAAVERWLVDGLKPVIDSAGTPEERVAMLEEANAVSQKFVNAHRKNAVTNLVYNNMASIGVSLGTTLDNFMLQGPAYQMPGDPDAEGAYYSALRGHESGGRNIKTAYEGGSAFGVYQITKGTWSGLIKRHPDLGLTEADRLTPEGQSKAIPALTAEFAAAIRQGGFVDTDKNVYMAHFLGGEGAVQFLRGLESNPNAPATAYASAEAVKANRNVFYTKDGRARTAQEVYARQTARFSAGITHRTDTDGLMDTSATIPALSGEIAQLEESARMQGVAPSAVNSMVITAVTGAMIEYGDPSLADAIMQPRPDGTPGAGMTLEGRQAIEQAKAQILNNQVKEENSRYAAEQRDEKVQNKAILQQVGDVLLEQLDNGETPTLPASLLREMNSISPDLADKGVKLAKSLQSFSTAEDTTAVAAFSAQVYQGTANAIDVVNKVAEGVINDPSTIRNLLSAAARNEQSSVLSRPIVRSYLSDIGDLVGDPLFESGVFQNPEKAAQATHALQNSVIRFEEQHPGASEADYAEFLAKETEVIVTRFKPDSDYALYGPGYNAAGQSDTPDRLAPRQDEAPVKVDTSRADSQEDGAVVPPHEGFNWMEKPAFKDTDSLLNSYRLFLGGDNSAAFSQWVLKLDLQTPEDIQKFVTYQKHLVRSQ
ncbi:hypothetical protein [Martelella mangrovi]|uniref:Transglycosylase SLT domain-containing protein n=1 Tax=Martelella mangrovi TaxID=1397477 RepID=A0ABV2IDW9_9HYPH